MLFGNFALSAACHGQNANILIELISVTGYFNIRKRDSNLRNNSCSLDTKPVYVWVNQHAFLKTSI